jgi:hypothetical protein
MVNMNTNQYSIMNDKQAKKDFVDDLNMRAAKHLVKLGIGKDWKKIYAGMQKRRRQRERST